MEKAIGMSDKLLKRIFWGVGIVMILASTWAWYDRWATGHQDANYGSLVPWGLWVAVYVYFSGLSAGAFLISSLVYVFQVKRFENIGRLALFTAVITLLLGLLSISVDLGHALRAWHVLAYPSFMSPMAWMIWLYTAYFVVVVLELWFVLRHDLVIGAKLRGGRATLYRMLVLGSRDESDAASASDRQIVRVLATIGTLLAITFPSAVGSLFGVISSRPGWAGGFFPVVFLVSALASGAALLALVSAIFQAGLRRERGTVIALGTLALGLLLIDLFLQVLETLIGFYGPDQARIDTLKLIFGGPYWWVFWVWQIGVGTLIPVMILALPSRRNPRLVAAACALITIGFLAVRLNLIIPGLASEQVKGISDAFTSSRVTIAYAPSLMEWLLSVGIVGMGLVMFGIGEWLLPHYGGAASEEVAHVTG